MKNVIKSALAMSFIIAVFLVNINHKAVSGGPVGVCCDFYPDSECVHPNDPYQTVWPDAKWFPGVPFCPVPPVQ
jgi:hypothetical protein